MREGFRRVTPETAHGLYGTFYATFSNVGIRLSKYATQQMGFPEYISIFINDDEKVFAVQVDRKQTDENFHYKNAKAGSGLLITAHSFRLYVGKLMGWDYSKSSYRVDGEFDADEKIAYFYLTKYTEKKVGKRTAKE